jgi:aspartyl protease family protein
MTEHVPPGLDTAFRPVIEGLEADGEPVLESVQLDEHAAIALTRIALYVLRMDPNGLIRTQRFTGGLELEAAEDRLRIHHAGALIELPFESVRAAEVRRFVAQAHRAVGPGLDGTGGGPTWEDVRQAGFSAQRGLGRLFAGLAIVALLGLYWFNQQQHGTYFETASGVAGGESVASKALRVRRGFDGHYRIDGAINGVPVRFMIDTGATTVAVPESVAMRAELPRGRSYQTRTANGTARAFDSRIDRLQVGPISLRNVRAGIATGLRGDEVLLGMSVLSRLEFSQRDGVLHLRQPGG